MPRNILVTSISVEGGSRSKTALRELSDTGTVIFRQWRAEATAAKTSKSADFSIANRVKFPDLNAFVTGIDEWK